jgi:hypothetical protein
MSIGSFDRQFTGETGLACAPSARIAACRSRGITTSSEKSKPQTRCFTRPSSPSVRAINSKPNSLSLPSTSGDHEGDRLARMPELPCGRCVRTSRRPPLKSSRKRSRLAQPASIATRACAPVAEGAGRHRQSQKSFNGNGFRPRIFECDFLASSEGDIEAHNLVKIEVTDS